MNSEINEPTLRLLAGIMDIQKVMASVLIVQGSLDRDALEYGLEVRLRTLPEGSLESGPLLLLLQHLRPDTTPPEKPRPEWLRVIDGGKPMK